MAEKTYKYAAFDELSEDVNVFLVDNPVLREAQAALSGCENCSADALLTFDYILDGITGCDPTATEYLLCRAAECPRCSCPIAEKTLVFVE